MYPVIFVGHGTPLNAIKKNDFTIGWQKIAKKFPKPRLIIMISAHWVTKSLKVLSASENRTIHDFYYFPKELYEVEYDAPGSCELAQRISDLTGAVPDQNWGLDHGAWTVLKHMYPEKDVKVVQLSIDASKSAAELFAIGEQLRPLRDIALIIGSGNIVHNLRKADFKKTEGYTWAENYDNMISDFILNRDYEQIINYEKIPESHLAFCTPEHFQPLLYLLGTLEDDDVEIFNQGCVFGSVSMTSYLFQNHK